MGSIIPTRRPDGIPIYHTTPRKIGLYTYFTGGDDDHSDQTSIGGDSNVQQLAGHHSLSDPSSDSFYMDFNSVVNETHIYEGLMMWKGALNDRLTFEVVGKVTSYSAGENTNYNLYNGYLIIPASGDGTISIASEDIRLVKMTTNEFGNRPASYWNADFNTSTKEFENITPAPNGDGYYNMFGVEVTLFRFANRLNVLGEGSITVKTQDITELGHNMRFKITYETVGDDHEWWFCANLAMYRKNTA